MSKYQGRTLINDFLIKKYQGRTLIIPQSKLKTRRRRVGFISLNNPRFFQNGVSAVFVDGFDSFGGES